MIEIKEILVLLSVKGVDTLDKINSEVFLKIAECGNFAGAAKSLGYTQAGISYIVNNMENELGFRLFIREYGGVRLSAEGKILLPYFRQLANDERLLKNKVNDLRDIYCGSIKVLVFNSVSVHWIPYILKEYRRDYPGISVELISIENSAQAEEMLARQDADTGFLLHEPRREDIDAIPLIKERMMAITALDHPLALQDRFPVSELGNYPYIQMAFGDETGVSDIFYSRGIKPSVLYNMDNDYAAMAMVSAGHGFCIFPELSLRDIPYKLRIMEFDEPVCRMVSIATKSMKNCSAATRLFIDYTQRWVAQSLHNQM